jgi:hypothetical protein
MATNTYVALQKTTLTSSASSVTLSSIPQTYTDLVLVISGSASASIDLRYTLNSDSGSNYSRTYLVGNGTSAISGRDTSITYLPISALETTQSMSLVSFMNYSNTTTFKTTISRTSAASAFTNAIVGLWRSTAAISSMTLTTSSGTITAGSTFSLYGIAAEGTTAKATGGQITSDSNYWYHTFVSSGTFTPLQSLTADYLVVAGGGGGGTSYGAGGGAGGLRCTVGATGGGGTLETPLSLTATGYTVTVGGGGANGAAGSNSVFGSITSTGGGVGGSGSGAGGAGGSGGGAGGNNGTTGGTRTASPVQGFNGGVGAVSGGAGGGGAGAIGGNASANTGGAGGAGATTSISGTSTTYAAGGGGYGQTSRGVGGSSIGGSGGQVSPALAATNGVANTGSGGGGEPSGAGGSGIVIVRYAK